MEHGTLFRAEMVRANLAGLKDQTRRELSRRNSLVDGTPAPKVLWDQLDFDSPAVRMDPGPSPGGNTGQYLKVPHRTDGSVHRVYPRIRPGDTLWVKETFALEHCVEPDQPPPHSDGRPIKRRPEEDFEGVEPLWKQAHYRATDPVPELAYEDSEEPGCRWKSSIFMPRWASRLSLGVTSVRVQRLQEISEADAIAEGIERSGECNWRDYGDEYNDFTGARRSYRSLWDSINGPGSWDENPWVWIYDYTVAPSRPGSPTRSTTRSTSSTSA